MLWCSLLVLEFRQQFGTVMWSGAVNLMGDRQLLQYLLEGLQYG